MNRALPLATVVAAAVAALSWASTFSLAPLLLPVLVPSAAVAVADLLSARVPVVRAVVVLAAGLGAVLGVFVLLGDAPADVLVGAGSGWRHTLESTLPARSDADLVAFVPVIGVLAAVLSTEWARRGAAPAVLLAPSFTVLALGQLFQPAAGWAALGTAVAYGLAAAAVLVAGRRTATLRGAGLRRAAELAPALVALAVVGGLVAWGASGAALAGTASWSVQDAHTPQTRTLATADPLEQIADRLLAGDTVAFTARSDVPVDRWPLATLDRFDGANWSSGGEFLALGTGLPPDRPGVPTSPAAAEIADLRLDGPWLPSQARLRAADGVRPLVDPQSRVLLRGADGAERYTLRWDAVQIDAEGLTASPIDPAPVGSVELDGIPAGISDLARQAVGEGVGPSVQAALLLEQWMRENYEVATGTDLPTGHSYAQLLHFLTTSKRGTSEQFATSYAVLARSLGIPTRIVVGFRDDGSGTVHQGDVLAWPEVAVAGIGWLPLDPTGGARQSGGGGSDLSAATQQIREELPSSQELAARTGSPVPAPAAGGAAGAPWWAPVLLALVALLVIVAVPVAKLVRRGLRRRPPPRQAMVGAWLELRDTLWDNGIAIPEGTTVRELVGRTPADPADVEELAGCLDAALYTGCDADSALVARAWAASGRIRRAVRRGSLPRRLRALFAVGTFRRRRD